ncbi:CHAT domain-containing protein [Qipengyuania zhejiangensis]|uniref:CHAT domain-containing protein n=1 Tax=Qipengyuania zhejiangensis TaxID=3077782 RepID=UPI002D77CE19|nr:CHAT domain-containing protein [Qipengyuania sp. Z2]
MSQKRWSIAFAPEAEAGLYQVTVRRSGAVHRFKTRLPPDISDLWLEDGATQSTRSFRGSAAELTPETRFFQAANMPTLKDIGERVLESIFDLGGTGEGTKIVGALEDRIADNEGIELEIDLSQTAELSGIPWESLYLRSRDRFLAIGTTSNIVRKLDAQSDLPAPIERPVRILVVAANPWRDLKTDVELGNIEARIDRLVAKDAGGFEIKSLPNADRDQLRRTINEWQPHIIHYIGHSGFADGEGYLALETGEEGTGDKLKAETFRNMLLNRRPWLVVLNSCQSGQTSGEAPMAGVAQNLLQRINVPFVIGMQQPVSDEAAINFSQEFYTALLGGETIANAVTLGRCAIASDDDVRTQVELITPALYTSGETDRIQFIDPPAAAVAAAAAGASGEPAAQGGEEWLSMMSRKASDLASIFSSLKVVAPVAMVALSYFGFDYFKAADEPAPAPAPVQSAAPVAVPTVVVNVAPATVPTDTPSAGPQDAQIGRDTPNGGPPPRFAAENDWPQPASGPRQTPSIGFAEEIEWPVTASGPPEMAERTIPTRPTEGTADGVSGEFVGEGAPRRVVRRVVRPIPTNGTATYTPETAYTNTDYSGTGGGGYAYVPDPQMAANPRFANVTAPAPLMELGGSFGGAEPMMEPQRHEANYRSDELTPVVSTDAWPEDLAGYRAPAFCDGLATTVQFDLGAATLNDQDRMRLQNLGDNIACPKSGLLVAGLTDSSGPDEFNSDLSMERAKVVADVIIDTPNGKQLLVADLQGYGERYPIIDAGDGAVEPANRRAEVYLASRCPYAPAPGNYLSFDPTSWKGGIAGATLPKIDDWNGEAAYIYYFARNPAEFDDEFADATMLDMAQYVAAETGLPPGAIVPMKMGPFCLHPNQNTRLDVTFEGGKFDPN